MTSIENLPTATSKRSPKERELVEFLPFDGVFYLFIDYNPAKLVLNGRIDAINEQVVSGLCDLSQISFATPDEIKDLLEEGKAYKIQIEASDQSLILYNNKTYLDFFFLEGQILFLQFAWAQADPDLLGWVSEKRIREQNSLPES